MRKLAGYLLTAFGLIGLAVEADGLITGTSRDLAVGLVLAGICIAAGVTIVRSSNRREAAVLSVEKRRDEQFETDILRLARDKAGRLGVVELAAALGTPLDDVDQALRQLVARGACEELVTDAGVSIFRFREFESLPDGKRDLLES